MVDYSNADWVSQAIAKGLCKPWDLPTTSKFYKPPPQAALIDPEACAASIVKKCRKTPQVEPSIKIGKELRIVLPILTKSEANQGGAWKGKSKRTKDARLQMSKLCGPHLRRLARFAEHYHAGGTLKATFTRLGGRHLDKLANLGAALKATEDAICMILGVNDGDPRWDAVPMQATGGPVGVLITISIVPLPVKK